MMRRKKWTLAAMGSLAFALLAVLIGAFHSSHALDQHQFTILEGHQAPVRSVAFSPDGSTLTTAAGFRWATSATLELMVWDLKTGRPHIRRSDFPPDLVALALSPDGRALAAAGPDGGVRWWDTLSPHECTPPGGSGAATSALAFSRDGSRLASADRQGTLTLWDTAGQRLWSVATDHDRFVFGLDFAPDGRTLATSGTDTAVRLWDTATGKERATLPGHTTAVPALAFAPDGQTVATGDMNGIVKLWDVATATERATLFDEPLSRGRKLAQEVTALVFSPDGTTLAAAIGPLVQLWDVPTGRLVAELRGHEGKVQCLAYSPDGARLASGSHDRTVRLWHTGAE
jgi:WD40 repeat protein